MATAWTNRGRLRLADGSFDADNLTAALLIAQIPVATIVDWNTDADITDELTVPEVASYARLVLGAATITEDDAADTANIDFANPDFGALEAPAITPALQISAWVAIRISTSEVMWVQDFAVPTTPNGQNVSIEFPTDGPAFIGF